LQLAEEDSVFLLDALPNRLGLSTKNQNSIDGDVFKKDLVGAQNLPSQSHDQ